MDLGKGPVLGLVKTIAIPASIGMFFSTMYNVVDTFYAGYLSDAALAGLALSATVYFLIMAIAIGLGQGTNALVSNALGAANDELARDLGGRALSLGVMAALLGAGIVLALCPQIFALMGASGAYVDEALTYIYWVGPSAGWVALTMCANGVLNAQGDTRSFRDVLIGAFFLNLILDPLFMFGFGWGVTGLAVATVVSQAVTALYMLWRMRRSELGEGMRISQLRPKLSLYADLLRQSIPASSNMLVIAIGSVVITTAVTPYGEDAVAAYGIALRLEQLVLLPSIGLNFAALSLVGYNYGAGNMERVQEIIRTVLRVGIIMMLLGGAAVFLLAVPLMRIFTDTANVVEIGSTYLRIEALILAAYAMAFICGAALQGLKRPMVPMVFNVMRQIVGPLALIALLVHTLGWGLTGVWWSIAIATWVVSLAQWGYLRRVLRAQT